MSWDLLGTVDGTTRKEALTAHPQVGYGEPESKFAIETTVQILRKLAESGAFGEGRFQVIVNGHSNPDHEPDGYYAKDYVQILFSKD